MKQGRKEGRKEGRNEGIKKHRLNSGKGTEQEGKGREGKGTTYKIEHEANRV